MRDGKLCSPAWVASLPLDIDNEQGRFLFQESQKVETIRRDACLPDAEGFRPRWTTSQARTSLYNGTGNDLAVDLVRAGRRQGTVILCLGYLGCPVS